MNPRSQPTSKKIALQREGHCNLCGGLLPVGSEAIYDWRKRSATHIECPSAVQIDAANELAGPAIDFGVAGASAQREYERRLAKDDERRRARYGRLAGVVHAWTGDRQSTVAWASGAEGERTVATALSDLAGVNVLQDRRVPRTRGNLDLLVIAPAGLFVVDAKNHGGTVRIRDRGSIFRSDSRLYVDSQDQSKLADGMGWQVEAVKSALAAANVDPLPQITPVLCFAKAAWPLLFAPGSFKGVRLEGLNSVKKLVVEKPTLDADAVDRYTRMLATAFPAK
jgi:hypothetical protein